uniref:Uncharacterized protein n=1 Tax=Oryza sativa subsp. japonica TaxID=39947 RepID=Q6Z3N8_ORYSJ|nr:hypothetical protein [Oryza sativa Japonica Group]BAD30573.1 hypothetical protein [Oryza sativa Japonica Group]
METAVAQSHALIKMYLFHDLKLVLHFASDDLEGVPFSMENFLADVTLRMIILFSDLKDMLPPSWRSP